MGPVFICSILISTGYSPLFSTQGQFAVDILQTCSSILVNRIETVFQEVLHTGDDQRLKRDYYFNRYEKFRPFKVGDLVWMNYPTTQRKKLDPKWKDHIEWLQWT